MFSDKDRDHIDKLRTPVMASCAGRLCWSERFIGSRNQFGNSFRVLARLSLFLALTSYLCAGALPGLAKPDDTQATQQSDQASSNGQGNPDRQSVSSSQLIQDNQKVHSSQIEQKAPSERHTMQLYYATTRWNEGSDMSPNYRGERHLDSGNGTLEFGTAGLLEPTDLKSPSTASSGKQYKRMMRQNADAWRESKFTFVSKTDEEDFFKHIHDWTGTICIYIHGYDKPFIEAAEDACLVFKDYQQYETTPQKKLLRILFSWPSVGGRTEYGTDEANLEWSAPAFDTFMDRVLAEKNPQAKLDIIGHSMGVRLIMGYLSKNCTIKDKPIFENVFLCSGDIDFLLMEGQKKLLDQAVADKAFIFVSDRDKAMILSHFVHEKPRLGRPIDPPKFTMAQRNQVFSSVYLEQILSDTSDLLGGNDYTESPDVKKWLADNPKLDQDFSPKSRLIDVSQLVTKDFGHGVPFSVLAAYMAGKGTPLLKENVVHKRPDRTSLKQNGGKPSHLYRFLRLEPINTD